LLSEKTFVGIENDPDYLGSFYLSFFIEFFWPIL